jgi:lipopolysaccharide export system protein LptA
MQLSVERVRWGLLAGALVLVAVIAGVLSYGHYRAVKAWRQILARSGATITHETNGVTYSQSVGGKKIFTVYAKREVPHGNGKYTLEDGKLVLFGPNGQPTDHISAAQMEYDEKQGVAHAAGEVDMEIEPPVALTSGRGNPAVSPALPSAGEGNGAGSAQPQVMHVRTSGLTYVKKLGVAATDQDVEIDYAGMHGHARGAEFDSGQDIVHLLADVRVNGNFRGAPATLTAAKADLDRDNDQIVLDSPVLHSGARMASAAHAVLHVRKDGSLDLVDANGSVMLREDTRAVTARTLHASMNERSQLKSAELAGGVQLADANPERPIQAMAETAKIGFDEAGYAKSAVMNGAVTVAIQDHRAGAAALQRAMGADRVTLTLERVKHGTRVASVDGQGNAWAHGNAVAHGPDGKRGALKTTSVAGDDLRLTLAQNAAGKDEPQTLNGAGHTRLEQKMPDGTVQTSAGDTLQAQFAQQPTGGLDIAAAEQMGNVQIRSVPGKPGEQPSDGVAERASFDGTANALTLRGHPRLTRGDTSVAAETIRMMQQTGEAVATGSVEASFVGVNAKPGAPMTHVLAAEAVLQRGAQTVEFHGTDTAPARMWQEGSQVQAANLLLDRQRDSMQAWPRSPQGVVRAIFASAASGTGTAGARKSTGEGDGAQKTKPTLSGERAVTVTSARMDYSGRANEAVFTGGVLAEGQDGKVHAQRGVAFLQPKQTASVGTAKGTSPAKSEPDPVAASVQKIVLSGEVRLEQPGRTATGDQLLYTAATGEYVLTGSPGHPPHVFDEKQGSITGATLLFRSPDSTIVVAGMAAGEPASHRVHTETTVKK